MADIPGVWSYLYKNDTNPGENFTRAYSAAKSAKNDEAALKQRADELANRRSEFEGEMGLRKSEFSQRQKEHQDRIDQDTKRRADILAEKFGPALVRGPDGEIDVQGSAAAAQDRIDLDRKAEALGMQEIMLGKQAGPEFDSVKMMPGYVVGQSKALERKQQQDALNKRATESAQSRIDAAKIRSGGERKPEKPELVEGASGLLFVDLGNGKTRPATQDEIKRHDRKTKAASATNAPPAGVIDLVPKAGGGWQRAN